MPWGEIKRRRRAEERRERRQIIVMRLRRLVYVEHRTRLEAMQIIAEEECRAVKTVYSWLERK